MDLKVLEVKYFYKINSVYSDRWLNIIQKIGAWINLTYQDTVNGTVTINNADGSKNLLIYLYI